MAKKIAYGSGTLFGIDLSSLYPTPVKFGILQDVNVEFSGSMKELHGGNVFAVAAGRGKSKITGKAKFAELDASVFATLFWGATKVTGQILVAEDEVAAIPDTPGPYTITVANAAHFERDLGVDFSLTGRGLKRVSGVPTTGQYAVVIATGVYTFAAADKLLGIHISYTYTDPANGVTVTLNNQAMGTPPTFQVVLYDKYQTQQWVLILNKCTASKLTFPTKQEDFLIQEFDFEAMADDSNNLGLYSNPY